MRKLKRFICRYAIAIPAQLSPLITRSVLFSFIHYANTHFPKTRERKSGLFLKSIKIISEIKFNWKSLLEKQSYKNNN